jgi:hypothetical protein
MKISAFKWLQNQSGFYLTGQVVAAYVQVRLTPQDFGSPLERDFEKLNLHLDIFEQPGGNHFFNNLLVIVEPPATAESDWLLHKSE